MAATLTLREAGLATEIPHRSVRRIFSYIYTLPRVVGRVYLLALMAETWGGSERRNDGSTQVYIYWMSIYILLPYIYMACPERMLKRPV